MAFLALSELKSFDIETLAKEIVNTKKQLFELRLKKQPVNLLSLIYSNIISVK